MTVVKRRLEDLARQSDRELNRLFKQGTTPELGDLAGWEFRGYNPPLFARIMGIRKFKKGFFWKEAQEERQLWGYNIPVQQDGIRAAWTNKHGDDKPRRFGWYRVESTPKRARDDKFPNSVLLDYGEGGNPLWDGTWVIRDYLVQVDEDNPDLFLGKAYVALGPLRVSTNFFILERLRESDYASG